MTSIKCKPHWFQIATRRDIISRGTKIALVVGTVLALLNHGEKLFLLELGLLDTAKIISTYFVPFLVSTYSAVQNELERYR